MTDQAHEVRMVAVELIDAGQNDRQTFDATELAELADSIAHHGLAQPPTLRPLAKVVREPVLGAHEIADLLSVKRTTVHQWRTRRLFPEPDLSVGAQPAWYRSTVTDWAARSGRAVQGAMV